MKCKYCGKEFDADKRHRFCSKECYRLYYNEYRLKKYRRIKEETPEIIKKRDQRTAELVRLKAKAMRRADMQAHARELVKLANKGNAEELITDYLLSNFIFRKAK